MVQTLLKAPTKERVEAAVEKLGYKPNAIAQGLALQKSTFYRFSGS